MLADTDNDQGHEFAFSDKQFHFLAHLANQCTGIVLADAKKNMVYSRLVRRIRALGLSGFSDYCNLLESDQAQDEMGHLVNAITTNLTKFFREEHHFEHLSQHVLQPMSAEKNSSKRLRVWSAGCSAGMESYSIAMTTMLAIKAMRDWDIKILATDIDTNMLEIATNGIYPVEQYQNIPVMYKDYVALDEGSMNVVSSVKEIISFKKLNLLEHWPMTGLFDAVFCRNVVIYFDKATQRRLFDRIANLLKPNGWLYIGHSENLFNVSDRFELIGRTIYRKIR
jgi:chemotaxis protein methyltransferase CheR